MDPKTVEVLGNLALKVLAEAMKQRGHGWTPPQTPAPDYFNDCSDTFSNLGIPPVFNPVDPRGFYTAPGFGWNGSPWPFC